MNLSNKIDVHAHYLPYLYRSALLAAGHDQPEGKLQLKGRADFTRTTRRGSGRDRAPALARPAHAACVAAKVFLLLAPARAGQHGRLKVVLADDEPPWDGVLVPTASEHHASLRRSLPALRPHPVLGKWLVLAAGVESFEDDARAITALALADDPRLGVEPGTRGRRGTPKGARGHAVACARRRRC